jgi:microcystin-dependent protein
MPTAATLGEIRMFAGNFAPRNWAFCQGQLLSISQNTALFSLLGTTFGGDGRTTFGLPDLRGRVAVGQGQGPGLQSYDLGEPGGTETVTLNTNEVPTHNHVLQGANVSGTTSDPTNNLPARPAPSGGYYKTPPVTTPAVMNAASMTLAGGGQAHNNIQPFLGMNFIIAVEGIFPSRN